MKPMNLMKLALFLLLALASACSGVKSRSGGKGEWVSLFDGQTLNGWTRLNGTSPYVVQDGAIVGETMFRSPNSFLCTNEHYGDFELEYEGKVDEGLNSGVQIRSLQKPPMGRVYGPQVEMETSPGQSGYVYGEVMSRGWISPEAQGPDENAGDHNYFKNGEWNQFRVVAKGPRIQVFLNGQKITDFTDEAAYASHPKGFIGLQVHGGIKEGVPAKHASWRNIRIREIR